MVRRLDASTALLVAVVIAATAGCAARSDGAPPTSTGHPPAASKPSSTPTPTPVVFTVPASCLDVVSKQRQATFASKGLTLLYGPGSSSGHLLERYPDVAEPSSISCDWGTPDESSSIEIDVGPVTPIDRAEIVAALKIGLLHTAPDSQTDVYYRDGVVANISAETDILRQASWVTVEILPGGADALTLATDVADEVETVTHAK